MISYIVPIFIFLTVIIFLYVIIKYSQLQENRFTKEEYQKIQSKWQQISLEANKHSIIEADKLLDFILKKYNLQGSVADKMKAADKLFSNSNNIWFAHKLRNKIAHDFHFEPSKAEIAKALRFFKQAYKDLGVKI